MKSISKRIAIVATIIALFAVATVGMPSAHSAELTASDKATEFLSSVVGLNLTKYTLTKSPTDAYRYPSEMCGIVKEECPTFKFETDGNKISIMSIFYNGQMAFFKITTQGDNYRYSAPPATDLLNQAKNILQRYHTYVTQVDSIDNSYIEPMQNILSSINNLLTTNITVGNVNLQVSENENNTRIQWIYTNGNEIMNNKRVELVFHNGAFQSFIDNWRLYRVSGPSMITSEEAYQIAVEAAQNYKMHIGHEDGTIEIATLPDLSNAFYQMFFNMAPYRNATLLPQISSKTSRDPLTLYPHWRFYFYFKEEKIAGCEGIQVGIWGDTKEISFCSGFGYYGASGTTSDEDTPLEEQQQQQQQQQQGQPNLLGPSVVAAAIIVTVIFAVPIPAIVLRRRKQRKC